jgi:hypothetical protein
MTHRHHDATVRQHHAHDPHQSLTSPVTRTASRHASTIDHRPRATTPISNTVPVTFR